LVDSTSSPNPNLLEVKECELKPREDDLRLMLLGLPGAGKSSSGNTILGQDLFESGGGFNQVTSETRARSAEVGGRRVTVVDTPGVPSEALSPSKLFKEIMRTIQLAAPGPHAFIIVVCIGRVTKADAEVFKLLPKMFDQDAPLFSIVLFTHADRLRNQGIQGLIRDNEAINLLVSKCGGRYCVFNNLQRDDRTQVHTLLTKVTAMVGQRQNREYSSKMFSRVHFLPVEVSIKWHDLRDWFLEFIEKLKQILKTSNDRGIQTVQIKHQNKSGNTQHV
uniref:GTPase IMAP family member 8 n=1 Tax=Neogobius melanostomus TaxID=47308 RepID=A0A8C6S5V0_9GOBI